MQMETYTPGHIGSLLHFCLLLHTFLPVSPQALLYDPLNQPETSGCWFATSGKALGKLFLQLLGNLEESNQPLFPLSLGYTSLQLLWGVFYFIFFPLTLSPRTCS